MELKNTRRRSRARIRTQLVAIGGAVLLVFAASVAPAQEKPPAQGQTPAPAPSPTAKPDTTAAQPAAKLPPEKLESLVAPIALYPDDLLAQTLVASTYPLEIVQLQQWMAKHKDLKDKALADSVAKQPWDPSIQSMAAVPEVVKRLADDIQWTTELGNAFLAQQGDVMDAVQRMRQKAKGKGALESNEQQKVETTVVEKDTVIIVQSANPEVVYVPSYSPTVVYGPPVYPYPPIYYPPPPPPGAAFVAFSVGFMWGAAMWGGPCCGCGWHGGGNVNINVNNNFNQINHYGGAGGAGGGNWQHNPQHRGGAPYGDKATATKYGGSGGRGASASNRQASARQQPASAGNRATSPSTGNRAASPSTGNRAASPSTSNRAASPSTGNRAASPSTSNRAGSGGGSDRIGNQSIPKSSSSKSGGFSGGSRGYSGGSARASSSRGASSMGSRGGGGGSRGGRR